MSITIKELTDELGVSKTAVRKKIDNLGLHSSLQLKGNQFVIDEKQKILIISSFKNQSKIKKETSSQSEAETVSTLVCMLQKELELKNKQIEDLNERLAESHNLIDQQQQLHAMMQKRVEALEKKEILNENENSDDTSYLLDPDYSKTVLNEKKDNLDELANNKSFWKSLREIFRSC